MTLIAKRLQQLSSLERKKFFTWIESMTVANDLESGPEFSAWLHLHESIPGDSIWIFYEPVSGALLGTASLVSQDRDLIALPQGRIIGGVNVNRLLRGQGYGTAIMTWLEGEIIRDADEKGCSTEIWLKANNPIAIHLYQSFGFIISRSKVDVYQKTYYPESRKSEL